MSLIKYIGSADVREFYVGETLDGAAPPLPVNVVFEPGVNEPPNDHIVNTNSLFYIGVDPAWWTALLQDGENFIDVTNDTVIPSGAWDMEINNPFMSTEPIPGYMVGKPNGVATLDGNGQVWASMLGNIDLQAIANLVEIGALGTSVQQETQRAESIEGDLFVLLSGLGTNYDSILGTVNALTTSIATIGGSIGSLATSASVTALGVTVSTNIASIATLVSEVAAITGSEITPVGGTFTGPVLFNYTGSVTDTVQSWKMSGDTFPRITQRADGTTTYGSPFAPVYWGINNPTGTSVGGGSDYQWGIESFKDTAHMHWASFPRIKINDGTNYGYINFYPWTGTSLTSDQGLTLESGNTGTMATSGSLSWHSLFYGTGTIAYTSVTITDSTHITLHSCSIASGSISKTFSDSSARTAYWLTDSFGAPILWFQNIFGIFLNDTYNVAAGSVFADNFNDITLGFTTTTSGGQVRGPTTGWVAGTTPLAAVTALQFGRDTSAGGTGSNGWASGNPTTALKLSRYQDPFGNGYLKFLVGGGLSGLNTWYMGPTSMYATATGTSMGTLASPFGVMYTTKVSGLSGGVAPADAVSVSQLSQSTYQWPYLHKALVNVLQGTSDKKIGFIGDSTVYGTGSMNGIGSTLAFSKLLQARGYPSAPGMAVVQDSGNAFADTRWTVGTGWDQTPGLGTYSWGGKNCYYHAGTGVGANTLVFNPNGYGYNYVYDTFDIYYLVLSGAGTFHVNIDGGTDTVVSTSNSVSSIGKTTITAATPSSGHVVNFGTTTVGAVFIVGVEPSLSTQQRFRVGCLGVFGSNTSGWTDTTETGNGPLDCIKAYGADFWFIGLGTNDAGNGTSVSTYLANLLVIVTACKLTGDVCVMSPVPAQGGTGTYLTNQELYAAALPAWCAANDVLYLDLFDQWGGANGYTDLQPVGFYFGLGGAPQLHPSTQGYGDIARAQVQLVLAA